MGERGPHRHGLASLCGRLRSELRVLVTGAGDGLLRLHNPSGIPPASQRDALVALSDFAKFYAERGMVIRN